MSYISLDIFNTNNLTMYGSICYNLGKFYCAFRDLDITLYIGGLTFQVENNPNNSFTEYYIDDEQGLIVRIYENLFSTVYNITHSKSCHIRLKISYSGVSNYKLLFPYMTNSSLLERISKFYEEAEIAFINRAWLSYSLMAGAVIEGLLFDVIEENKSFDKLIEDAYEKKYIDDKLKDIIKKAKDTRNLVHANRYGKNYATREMAYNIKYALDEILYSFETIRNKKRINK